ncbi:MAG: hypothetical protein Q9176_003905 [Flavoplaca citrina]
MTASALARFGTRPIVKGIGALFTAEVIESGSGSYVTMVDAKMLNFMTSIGVANLGHCHPAVTKAAQSQVAKLVHGQINIALPKLQSIVYNH